VGGFQLLRLEKNQDRTLRFVNKSLKMPLKTGIKLNINNLLKKEIYQYIQDTIQVFQISHNLCSELTSILAIQEQPTNRPQLNKSDRPQVNIWDT
jgi:hypothetical protein